MSMGGLAGFCQVLPFAKAAEAADRPPAIAWRPVLAQTDDEYHDLLFDQEAGTRRTDDVRSLHSRVPDRRTPRRRLHDPAGGRPRQSVTY